MRVLGILIAVSGMALPGLLACDDNPSPSCKDGSTSLQIQAKIDNCPTITSIVVTPSNVPVGQSGLVTATATDQDSADVLTFAWTAASGTFTSPAQASTPYTCAEVGASTLTVKVSDGRCDSRSTVIVTCSEAP